MTTPSSGHGAVPIGPDDERRAGRPAWLIPLLAALAVLLLALLLWLLLRDGDEDDQLDSAASPSASAEVSELPSETPEASDITTTQPTAQGSSSATATASAAPSATPAAPSAPARAEVDLTAGDEDVFPLRSPDQDLSGLSGEVVGTSVPVESVPADEGFWLGTGPDQRVWVEIVAIEGETPFVVAPGDTVSFSGAEVVPHDAGYAQRLNVTAEEGGDQLTAQKAHVQVRAADLRQG